MLHCHENNTIMAFNHEVFRHAQLTDGEKIGYLFQDLKILLYKILHAQHSAELPVPNLGQDCSSGRHWRAEN